MTVVCVYYTALHFCCNQSNLYIVYFFTDCFCRRYLCSSKHSTKIKAYCSNSWTTNSRLAITNIWGLGWCQTSRIQQYPSTTYVQIFFLFDYFFMLKITQIRKKYICYLCSRSSVRNEHGNDFWALIKQLFW